MQKVDQLAEIIFDYMQLHQRINKADALFVLCSHDTRVAGYAAELFHKGVAPIMIISGGSGVLTKDLFTKPEAEVFADIVIGAGVPESQLIIEITSTNTGENIRFSYDLLQKRGLDFSSFILVQKPYMERRTFATFVKQWPGRNVNIQVTSPRLTYQQYFSGSIDKEMAINVMVGDLQRIKEYPKMGFQIEQDIPKEVWAAFESLVALGYTKHLL